MEPLYYEHLVPSTSSLDKLKTLYDPAAQPLTHIPLDSYVHFGLMDSCSISKINHSMQHRLCVVIYIFACLPTLKKKISPLWFPLFFFPVECFYCLQFLIFPHTIKGSKVRGNCICRKFRALWGKLYLWPRAIQIQIKLMNWLIIPDYTIIIGYSTCIYTDSRNLQLMQSILIAWGEKKAKCLLFHCLSWQAFEE